MHRIVPKRFIVRRRTEQSFINPFIVSDLQKTCRFSETVFQVDEQDQSFYESMGVPVPTLCPDERQRRRMSWRNERNLYRRQCDACQKMLISIYREDSPFTVYCNACWWSDDWDAMSFGQEIDFSRPFFEQMRELMLKVPRLALYQKNSENSDYTNHSENNRDCYLCVDTAKSQHVFHSKWIIHCQDCSDCYNLEDAQLCYESQYQVSGYNNRFNFFADFSQESQFLYSGKNCQNVFMSSVLNRAQYVIRNQQVTKEDYETFMAEVDLGSYTQLSRYYSEYIELIRQAPKRPLLIMTEDCVGDCLYKCKNVRDSFDVIESRDCRYCYESGHMVDCYDVYELAFECERQYECHGCNRGKFLVGCNVSYDLHDSFYADMCHNSGDLFGCVGLRRKQYVILNKQYSKEAYLELVARLKIHMQETGEWGEFFPTWMSPFAYNETIAQEYYPLSKDEASARGYAWLDDRQSVSPNASGYALPDHIKDTPDEVCEQVLICEVTGKPYKIIPQELALHRKLNVALPRRCPQQRYLDRLALRNPRRLWDWDCVSCQSPFRAPYDPSTAQGVYCQDCFVAEFYA
jgi:hypothetical protein